MQMERQESLLVAVAVALVIWTLSTQQHALEHFRRGQKRRREQLQVAVQQKFAFTLPFDPLEIAAVYSSADQARRRRTRQWWKRPRSSHNYHMFRTNPEVRDDASNWKGDYRMSQETFQVLLERLEPRIAGETGGPNEPVPADKKLLCALFYFAHSPDSLKNKAKPFGLGASTVHDIVSEVSDAIWAELGEEIECDWEPETVASIARGFRSTYTMLPNCAGAIDGTHFNMSQPRGGPRPADYFDRKHNFSIVMQAVVDSNLRIIDFYVGEPGSVHDTRVLHKSKLWDRARKGEILQEPTVVVEGVPFKPFLLGDAGYPLLPWLLTPFLGNQLLSQAQQDYNYWHSSSRMVVERAFGMLKNRWRLLLGKSHIRDPARMCKVVAACVALHNFCLTQNDDTVQAECLDLVLPEESGAEVAPIPGAIQKREALVQFWQANKPSRRQ